ncbi:hypothetical protein [Arenimonas alkanexedens]
MDVRIQPATTDALAYIGQRLRRADRIELGLGKNEDGVHVLLESAEAARWCHVAHVDGVPAAVYGVNPHGQNPRWGAPWLLATDEARRLRRELLTHSVPEVELMLAGFPFLINIVHDRHHAAIRWLIWLGFTVAFDQPQRRGGLTFLPFWMGNQYV